MESSVPHLLVQKFGGTSVQNPERIRAVAKKIADTARAGHRLAVVVSAMGHTTDELLHLAQKVSEKPPHREMDMLLSAGERISMALLSMALSDLGISAVSFTGSQSGIITDNAHRRARIQRILGNRVREALESGKVAIVAGFQGVSESKDVTTLGRGGSDTTAVGLAVALGSRVCEIYTDVDGVYSADPRTVHAPKLWQRLSHSVMLELAYRGAGVLHPRSVELARKYGVEIHVKNSLNDHPGTEIMTHDGMEAVQVAGVTSDPGRMPLCVQLARSGVLGSVLDYASKAGLTVMAPLYQGDRLWIFIDRSSEEDWKTHLDRLIRDEFVRQYEFQRGQVPVSVVGECISQDGTVFHRAVELLSEQGISVSFAASSALALTLSVPEAKAEDAVRALHEAWVGGNS